MSGFKVDIDQMYRSGFGSVFKPSHQQSRNDLIDGVFRWAGQKALSHYQNTFKELGELKRKNSSVAAAMNMQIEKVGDNLNPQVQEALDIFKSEYDKGARMLKLGITGKRKNKGQEMMDVAMLKMTKLNEHLGILQKARETEQKRARVLNGDLADPGDGSIAGYNAGAIHDEMEYSAMLANGTLLQSMEVDPATGEIRLVEMEGTGVFYDDMDGNKIEELTGQIEYTALQDITFAPPSDDALQNLTKTIMETSYNDGHGGKHGEERNPLTLDKIRGHVNGVSDNAIKDWNLR